jgi:septum site-determining protein MinC
MNLEIQQNIEPAFKLKGSILTLSVLQLLSLDYVAFERQLEDTVQKNPNFFIHMPIVLDLQKLFALDHDINFSEIHSLLRKNNLVPIGITNANPKQVTAATQAGFGILPSLKPTQAPKAVKKIENTKIVTQPVRSGQQIYARNSDLIILSSVSNGAEVLADGNIHIYGILRGRAIAGVSGEVQARIFCQRLEAELVAIAGHYKLQEDINVTESGNIQVFLENNQLIIASLNS